MSAAATLSAGALLGGGRYVVVRLMAAGAFGAVYEARSRSGRGLAIKTLSDPRALKRFQREAKLLRRARHPHLVRCLAFGYDPGVGVHFLVMPLLHGQTLAERLRGQALMPLPDVVRVLGCVAGALDALHRLGLVHRDVKPSNVIVSLRLRPLRLDATLIDLGLAWVSGDERLTQAQRVVGTPSYMAPEQIAGEQIDGRADIYALAAVAFEMLTGKPPFSGQTPDAVMAQHLHGSPPDVRALRPDLPPEVQGCFEDALAKDASRRPARVKAWVRALGDAFSCGSAVSSAVTSAAARTALDAPKRAAPKGSSQTHGRRGARRRPIASRRSDAPPALSKPAKGAALAIPAREDVLWRVVVGLTVGALMLWALLSLRS